MTKLMTLYISGNPINSISFFSNFIELKYLQLNNTGISDISSLSGLKNLIQVHVSSNNITDISAIVSAKSAGAFTNPQQNYVDVSLNFLDISLGSKAYNDIQTLKNGGVNVKFSPQKIPTNQNQNRIYGQSRFETAAAISQSGWVTSDCVVLANAYAFPDALAGTPFAYLKDAALQKLLKHILICSFE